MAQVSDLQRASKFWDDPDPDLYVDRPRALIPQMPIVGDPIQVYSCVKGHEKAALAYLACVLRDAKEKLTVMTVLASAVSILFGDTSNFTGSPTTSIPMKGLEIFSSDTATETAIIQGPFESEVPLTMADVDPYMECDVNELGGYFGVLFVAGSKKVTSLNAAAFNSKRLSAIMAASACPPLIFVPASTFLDEQVLNKVYAAFTAMAAIRCQLVYRTCLKMSTISYGPRVTFAAMFLLLVDQGIGSLNTIRQALQKHREIVDIFPEVRPELESADKGIKLIRSAETNVRPFVKAIYGASFVPAQQADIGNLLGIARKVMTYYTPTFGNFKGGFTTPAQDAKIAQMLGIDFVNETARGGVI